MPNARLFSGSGMLGRFILRRDRLRLSLWLVGLVAFSVIFVPVFENMLSDAQGGAMMAEMMKNPAMVAIVGPVYGADNYNTGAAYANMMFLFAVMLAGVMNIFLITRCTRQDEEQGRMEVIRSLPVGRLSSLASALSVAAGINLLLSAITGLGLWALRQDGMTLSGCALFGAGIGAMGLFFAAAAAVFCQLTANNRTATALSFLLMFVLYLMRAAGDTGAEVLSVISPLGLVLRVQVFVKNIWWPLGVIFALSISLAALSFALAQMRDLGGGLIPERAGRRHASKWLNGPFGLALKLTRTSVIIWMIVIFVFVSMYGSVFGDLDGFIASSDMLSAIFSANSGFSLAQQFIVMLMSIMSMIATLPVLSLVHRIAGEEKCGHAEHILSKAVSRQSQMAVYFVPAIALSVVLQALSAAGFWLVGSMVMESTPSLPTFLVAAFSYLPAVWAMTGVSMALTAFLPGMLSLSYAYLGYSFISVYLGQIAGFPGWMQKLSPFGHIPQYPIESVKAAPLVALLAISAALAAAAFAGYRKRDVKTQ